ncbi:MAG: SpaH/EbpB family LPXTG-anchored major pilin [Oscillospiraceae bacterium]|nr:SpaH/EbpB family LPXTG-anchored major pilin [Oscillospiraceae bacterium]
MKTTKRVLAIVLAALMLALMVPFAASAATPNVTFTLSYDQPADEADGAFEWTVYQLATLDTETGALTIKATDSAIVSALKANSTSSATILEKCDAATSGFGTATGGTFASGDADKTYTVAAGIYYVKCTTAPASATLKNNSIVALPYYSNNAWQNTLPASASTEGNKIKLATKFSNSPTSIVKKVKDVESGSWVDATSQQQDKDVQFRTFVTTAGSATERLASYRITDSMNNGLKLKSIDSVKFFEEATSTSGTTVPAAAYNTTKDDTSFEIAFTEAYLTADEAPAFYSNKYIEVLYTCTVLDSAEVGDNENVNTTTMYYKPSSATTETPVGPDTAQVYVYEAGVYKYDASKTDTNTPLANAEFAIYATKANAVAGTNAIAVAKTGTDGKAKFVAAGTTKEFKFAKGTYFVKETKAPTNYNLNSEVKEITLGATAASTTLEEVSIGNTPSKLPETGGEGTMMFMIIGGSLILLAGVLFVVVMKKRSSK